MNHRLLIVLAVLAGLLLLALIWLALRIRRRWRQGKQDFAELRNQARSMQLEQQGMAGTASASNRPRQAPPPK